VTDLDEVASDSEEARTLHELAREEGDEDAVREAIANLESVEARVARMEFRRMMSGEHDARGAVVSINAGAGGVDSQDWAEMLLRMYSRWGERQGFKVEVVDLQEAEQAGIRSAEVVIDGEYAYGLLRAEVGVHRLVRISPFDAQARRQTSFASVMVTPDFGEQTIEIEVRDADLRVDTYRSSGKGGQHVNKTDSAVRLTHLPTGVVVACQMERSQHKNMARAMSMLKARLWALEEQKRQEKVAAIQGDKQSIEWGSQIRSYVLQPYRQVNDHRTELKMSNVDAVLDGDLDDLIAEYLLMRGGKPRETASA
jgi:peptide chain release factor 2